MTGLSDTKRRAMLFTRAVEDEEFGVASKAEQVRNVPAMVRCGAGWGGTVHAGSDPSRGIPQIDWNPSRRQPGDKPIDGGREGTSTPRPGSPPANPGDLGPHISRWPEPLVASNVVSRRWKEFPIESDFSWAPPKPRPRREQSFLLLRAPARDWEAGPGRRLQTVRVTEQNRP